MVEIFAITTRGLEGISAKEMAAVPGIRVQEQIYRRILAEIQGDPTPLLNLRTVDDVFLHAADWSEIGRSRLALKSIQSGSEKLPLDQLTASIMQVREIPEQPAFSVTASFVGKRNYSAPEIKHACAEGIMAVKRWQYSDDDSAADLNIRIFIEHEDAMVGIRFGAQSLWKRSYKQYDVPGSLKASVAAAMVALADVKEGERIIDPCCGAGTILLEASSYHLIGFGGDISRVALDATRKNAQLAGIDLPLAKWDGQALPLADRSIDCIICNLPWGRAVSDPKSIPDLYAAIGSECERVLVSNGRIVLLTNQPDLLQIPDYGLEESYEISLFGQTPTILRYRRA